MDANDLELRNITYQQFVRLGRAPTAAYLGQVTGRTTSDILAGWHRLHDQHALVLNPATDEIRMVNPFSAVPTAYRVRTGDRSWYGNCAWDAVGICAALHSDGRIDTTCPDCGEPIILNIERETPDRHDLLFHCLVSAAHWWDDIVFT